MKGNLQLDNGVEFYGELTNPHNKVAGEIFLYTGMTGFETIMTDPELHNKIIVFTFPIIGISGMSNKLFNIKPTVAAVVAKTISNESFHYQATNGLFDYLKKWNIPTLINVDTRQIVKEISKHEVKNGMITFTQIEAVLA